MSSSKEPRNMWCNRLPEKDCVANRCKCFSKPLKTDTGVSGHHVQDQEKKRAWRRCLCHLGRLTSVVHKRFNVSCVVFKEFDQLRRAP